MATEREIAPGLYPSDVEKIADQIYNRKDVNCPILSKTNKNFVGILKNGKQKISVSPVFVKKVHP